MSLSQNILSTVVRWKALPLKSLFQIEDTNNYNSFIVAISRAKKKGLLNTTPMGTNLGDKIAYPTEKLLTMLNDEDTIKINIAQIRHDALVSLICLAMIKIEPFIDADIDDRLYGINRFKSNRAYFPDAILTAQRKRKFFDMPVEFELTQKSVKRIEEKFKPYVDGNYYHYVLFVFIDKRLCEKYHTTLHRHYHGKEYYSVSTKFIFLHVAERDLINLDLSKSSVIHDKKEKTIYDIWGKLLSYF